MVLNVWAVIFWLFVERGLNLLEGNTNFIVTFLFFDIGEVQVEAIYVGDAGFDLVLFNWHSFNYNKVQAIDRVENFVRSHQCGACFNWVNVHLSQVFTLNEVGGAQNFMFSCKELVQLSSNAFQSAVTHVANLIWAKFSIGRSWLLSWIMASRVVTDINFMFVAEILVSVHLVDYKTSRGKKSFKPWVTWVKTIAFVAFNTISKRLG